ncbi:hypothetical protein AAE478_005497 [Parahypoxylon ruwenzoriense]
MARSISTAQSDYDVPPPYSETEPPGGASAAAAAAAAAAAIDRPLPQIPAQIKRQFPPMFNLYRVGGFGNLTLGEHQAQPLYSVTLHSGWSGNPDIILHNGPAPATPTLAAVEFGMWSSSAIVHLPPLAPGAQAAEEKMEAAGGGRNAYVFRVETGLGGVGGGGQRRRETFEWRHSRGDEVKALGGQGKGWKLVRMETGGGTPGAAYRGAGQSSDGKEVVAVWSWAAMSVTKTLKFRFLGSGATGVLGERWAVMAVATALRIWDRERRQRSSRAAGAAGAGGGGGA